MVYDCKYGLNVNYASSSSNQVMPVISTVIEGNTVSATSSGYAVDCATEPAAPEIEWKENKTLRTPARRFAPRADFGTGQTQCTTRHGCDP